MKSKEYGPDKNKIKRSAPKAARPATSGRNSHATSKPKGHPVKAVGSMRHGRKKYSGRQIFARTGITIVTILLIFILGIVTLWNYIFSGLEPSSYEGTESYPTEALTHQPPNIKEITNILLLGVDTTNDTEGDNGRSDSIIILTINRKTNTVKMTSIMRDCYVYIPGYQYPNKLNAAYSFGGPELTIRTISNTLRLNIDKYAVVNMENMVSIIDIAGGVTIDVDANEMRDMNKRLWGESLTETGLQELNGKQAVQYARIRKIDSDWARTGRQREVLMAMFRSFKDIGTIQKTQMLQKGISYIQTNLTASEITFLALDVLPKISTEVEMMKLPLEGYYKVNSIGIWYMIVDYNRMIPEVYKFIYGEEHPFDPVPTIYYKAVSATPSMSSDSAESYDSIESSMSSESHESSESSQSESSGNPYPTFTSYWSDYSDPWINSFDPYLTPTQYISPIISPEVTISTTPTSIPWPTVITEMTPTSVPTLWITPTPIVTSVVSPTPNP